MMMIPSAPTLTRNNFHYTASVKVDVSQFTYLGKKTWSIDFLETFGFTKFLMLLIVISGNVVSCFISIF